MHPAGSVIFFTVASGAGYGMLALTGVLAVLGLLPDDWVAGFAVMLVALGLVTAGLLSSTFHLGHPERAWRAFSQWRSSWLSREGVAAVVTYLPAAILGWVWVFDAAPASAAGRLAGAGLAVMSIVTIYCTAMIYRSLKPIPAWCNGWTVPGYLVLGLASGAMLLIAVFAGAGVAVPALTVAAVTAALGGWALKSAYWRKLAQGFATPTRESATGLVLGGDVHPLEDPHSSDNYLMKEMGYRVGRKHAARLRRVAIVAGFAAPSALAVLALVVPSTGLAGFVLALAAIVMLVGLLAERWLFFAEARHVVTLYYRDRTENTRS